MISGWTCSGGTGSTADTCFSTCGDGYMVVNETCDDGSNDGNGCLTGCLGVANGWECNHTSGASSACAPICGDG